jgi:hypothetical protein
MRSMSGVDLSNPDPLGIGKRSQAMNRRWAEFGQGGSIGALMNGNAMDPQWDGFLESTRGANIREGEPMGFGRSGVQYGGQLSNQIGMAGRAGDMLRGLERAAFARQKGGR